MKGNHLIKFRVNGEQLSRINLNVNNKGYSSIAAYMRDLALKRNDFIDSKIIEIAYDVKKILEVVKNGRIWMGGVVGRVGGGE